MESPVVNTKMLRLNRVQKNSYVGFTISTTMSDRDIGREGGILSTRTQYYPIHAHPTPVRPWRCSSNTHLNPSLRSDAGEKRGRIENSEATLRSLYLFQDCCLANLNESSKSWGQHLACSYMCRCWVFTNLDPRLLNHLTCFLFNAEIRAARNK